MTGSALGKSLLLGSYGNWNANPTLREAPEGYANYASLWSSVLLSKLFIVKVVKFQPARNEQRMFKYNCDICAFILRLFSSAWLETQNGTAKKSCAYTRDPIVNTVTWIIFLRLVHFLPVPTQLHTLCCGFATRIWIRDKLGCQLSKYHHPQISRFRYGTSLIQSKHVRWENHMPHGSFHFYT